MKLQKLIKLTSLACLVISATQVYSGNKDRAGSAGGQLLLINPYARTTGMFGANAANVTGIESIALNVAGTAFTKKSEFLFARTSWLSGSQVFINSLGFSQKMGTSGVLGIFVTSMNLGQVEITTVNQPEGGIGFFNPNYLNVGVSYAKQFSNSISGGLAVKILNESIADASAQGVCFDAGVRYVTGEKNRIKFGVALRNLGPTMRYRGDGLSFRTTIATNNASQAVEQRSDRIELPSSLSIAGSYDFFLAEKHTLTANATFQSNSFTQDQFMAGVEYNFSDLLLVRAGHLFERYIFKQEERLTAFTGLAAGMSIQLPLGKGGSKFSIDYSYRHTNPFNGTHVIGARITL
jgi:hypothetical protein